MAGALRGGNLTESSPRLVLGVLLVVAFLVRVAALDQPIVENYVGRQIPTAMVARNLGRGSGFLEPRLDVAPFPNRFLVEPPLYAGLSLAVRRLSGLALGASGRLVSALGTVLALWGLYGLTARREGTRVALWAVGVFACFPVTLRYGRSFQPDALMLGSVLAGMRCWDDFEWRGGGWRLAAGFAWLALGFSLKVTSCFILIPLVFVVIRKRRPWFALAAGGTLVPALLWYAHAAGLLGEAGGSRASAMNREIWLSVFVPGALGRRETYGHLVRFLGLRAFTPLGPWLALAGYGLHRPVDRLWIVWGTSTIAALLWMAAKLHHEYYWLALAPVLAVGIGKTLEGLSRQGARGRWLAGAAAALLLGLSAVFSASTWKTPPEWSTLSAAARAVRETVPPDAWVVAPEALLFEADRRGCRLEFTPGAARRAAEEWGEPLSDARAIGLVEFYRRHGARYFADVQPEAMSLERLALHDAVRRRYNVQRERDGVLIADLNETSQRDSHGTGQPADTR
ncbi:MAG: hypothetical protein NVSMB9_16710 [Isosphaeraceae bacterium]